MITQICKGGLLTAALLTAVNSAVQAWRHQTIC